MKNNKEKIEKVQDDIRQEYGDEEYDMFLDEVGRMFEKLEKDIPLFGVKAPDIEPDDVVTWKVSANRPFPTISVTKFQEVVDQRYKKLKDRYGYGGKADAFDELKEQLIREGKDPARYGLKFDPYTFDKAYRKRKNKRSKK